jgi:IS5 family transposase
MININILWHYSHTTGTTPMFRKKEEHHQKDLFGLTNTLPEKILLKVRGTEEYYFYTLIFSHINEEQFSVLFSNVMSRPNAPVNCLVGAIILQNRRSWTFDELFTQLQFNILVRFALGLDDLETMPFCRSTLFNFQNRLSEHQVKTGENLLECVFDQLTERQLKTLKIKTSIQRTDSTFAASNIRNYTRLQLLVETLIRTERILNQKDSKRFRSYLAGYVKGTSEKYIYQLKNSDIPHELEQIAKAYLWVFETFKSRYGSDPVFSVFERIFKEQFKEDQGAVIPRDPTELHFMSPRRPILKTS